MGASSSAKVDNFDKKKTKTKNNDGEYFCSKMVVDSVSLNSWLHMWARMCQVQHDDDHDDDDHVVDGHDVDDHDDDDHDDYDHDYYGDHLDHD